MKDNAGPEPGCLVTPRWPGWTCWRTPYMHVLLHTQACEQHACINVHVPIHLHVLVYPRTRTNTLIPSAVCYTPPRLQTYPLLCPGWPATSSWHLSGRPGLGNPADPDVSASLGGLSPLVCSLLFENRHQRALLAFLCNCSLGVSMAAPHLLIAHES